MIFQLRKDSDDRRMLINSCGRKVGVHLYNTCYIRRGILCLVPLFYSTSFGSAYWIWLLILFTFITRRISYEFQNKAELTSLVISNMLIINGILDCS